MKYLLIIIAALSLCSCSMSHKITTTTRSRTDSVSVVKADSANVRDSSVKTDTLSLDSASITVVLDTTTTKCCDTLTNPQAQMIHDLVKAVSDKQRVKSVTITIHGLKKAAKVTVIKDSTIVHKSDSVHKARDVTTVIKDVKTTSYVAFGIIFGLAILAIIVIKFKIL